METKPTFATRVHRLLRRPPQRRRLTLVYDRMDAPPWTAELVVDDRLVAIRAGATLQAAISAVIEAELRRSAPGARTLDRSPAALERRAARPR